MSNAFISWFDRFLSEKEIDLEWVMQVSGRSGINFMPVGVLVEAIKGAPRLEQEAIKSMIVKIDFHNGDVMDYFKHLAGAIAC